MFASGTSLSGFAFGGPSVLGLKHKWAMGPFSLLGSRAVPLRPTLALEIRVTAQTGAMAFSGIDANPSPSRASAGRP